MREPYYELKKSSDGQYFFNLRAANHEPVATSERYPSKAVAKKGIDAVRRAAPTDVVKDETGE